ncbi:unnamed protein product [Ceratitis capitata]|uniref:(Mediterranean fruit fly) hypothetical protein n=1 Tax=Ceratitis capitata TaxID=7213 RepID=A0A811V647_CERCA|nr:unnamed protein product [Ceratitis capitata]
MCCCIVCPCCEPPHEACGNRQQAINSSTRTNNSSPCKYEEKDKPVSMSWSLSWRQCDTDVNDYDQYGNTEHFNHSTAVNTKAEHNQDQQRCVSFYNT